MADELINVFFIKLKSAPLINIMYTMLQQMVSWKPVLIITLSQLNIASTQLTQSYLFISEKSMKIIMGAKFNWKFWMLVL